MKKCKQGYYYCYKDKKCKKIPTGYRVGLGGWLRREKEEEKEEEQKNGNGANGNGNGNGDSSGDSNGGGVSEAWSAKYKRSIDCNNPKGFSQRAHCQGRKKVNEEKKDHEYSMARSEVKIIKKAAERLQKKMGKKGEGNLQAWVQSKITKAADYIDTAADYVTNKETVKEEGLRDWFGKSKSKDGKKGWVNVVTGDSCASDKPGEGIPKCVSSAKRASMSKKERLAAQRAKRRQDPGQQEKSGAAAPTMVKTDRKIRKEEMEVTEAKDKPGKGSGKKDACYHKVKSRYSVWPSAYASGALVKCRKVGAANWGNKTKNENYDYSNWRDDFKALEIESIDIIKPEPLQATDGIGSRMLEEGKGKKCWKGYKKAGTQKLFGKTYNRCVKEGNKTFGQFVEDWQKVNKGDKTDGMSQKAVNAYKRENPGSKLQTAVTEKKPTGKRAKRRTSFCARSKGQKDMHNIDCTKTPDKAICKARKRWNC